MTTRSDALRLHPLRSLALTVTCLLLAATLGACKDKSSAPASEPAEKEAPKTPVADAAAMASADTAVGVPTEDLAFQDTLRLLQSGAAYLALEAALGATDSRARQARVPLAQAIGADDDDPEFVEKLVQSMRSEIGPYKHGALRTSMMSLEQALDAALGGGSPSAMATAARQLRDARPSVALVGSLLELALAIKAWSSGVGTEGTPTWGFASPLVCPSAGWHKAETVFAAAASGASPADIDLFAQLQACFSECAGVSGAPNASTLATALAACPGTALPLAELGAEELESPVSVLDVLAVGAILEARERVGGGEWRADDAIRKLLLDSVDGRIEEVTLPLDWVVTGADTPGYPHLTPEVARTTYILALGGEARFGMWPYRVVKNGLLEPAPLAPHQERLLQPVELAVPSALRRTIRGKLQPVVGLMASVDVSFAELREAMRATRAVGLERRFLVVVDQQGERRWLALDSNPSAEADVLVRQGPGQLTVWISPGQVTRSALDGIAGGETATLSGRVEAIPVGAKLSDAIPAIHDLLAREATVGRVLVDLDDGANVGEFVALLNALDFPRPLGASSVDALLGSEPVAGSGAERRLEAILVAEHRTGELGAGEPALAPPREGVTLPAESQITVAGPVQVADVSGLLAGLALPLRNCFERALAGNPALAGDVVVQLTLDAEGKVTAVSTTENTSGSELLQACVEDGVEQLVFPVPEGNAELAVVKFPVRFDPPLPADEEP